MSRYHFKSHMKSSFHSLNSSLTIILQLLIPKTRLSSIPVIPSSYPGRLASRNSTVLLNWTLLYDYLAWTTQKTQSLYCWEGVFTAPLHSNGSYSIVACVFISAGMCLPSRCLAMNVYSDFTVPVSGIMSVHFILQSPMCSVSIHVRTACKSVYSNK
jgi:hypothetical protein